MSLPQVAWPMLVDVTGEAAKTQIEAGNPGMTVEVVAFGMMVTMDYREDRIRIFVDEQGLVKKPPRVG